MACMLIPAIAYFAGGLAVGTIGSIITMKIISNKTIGGGSGNAVDQSRSRAGGDITGRDKRG